MKTGHRKHKALSPLRMIIALVALLAISLSMTSEVFADHCGDTCHSESSENKQSNDSNNDCGDCLCCLPVIKVIAPEVSQSGSYCGPVSIASGSNPLNDISSPSADIDHPPQNLL